jgi:hypothetical protein
MGETGGGGGMAKDRDLLRSRGPHGSPGDPKRRPETREDALLAMRDRKCMAESPIFALAERPEPR